MLPEDDSDLKSRRVSLPVYPPSPPSRRHFPLHLGVKRRRSGPAPERRVNCVLVGDGAVGKSSLVISYTTNGYPVRYVPTAFDNFTVMVVVDGTPVRLQLCDTAGQKWGIGDGSINDELERLRPLCYRNADVFLLCYSVVRPDSFRNLTQRWLPEIRRHCPGAPLVLVGTQLDLREDVQVLIHLAQNHERPVGQEDGRQLAQQLGATGFAECSALTQKNLKEAFDSAILASIQQMEDGSGNVNVGGVLPQGLTNKRNTPDKIKKLSEAWWSKIRCLVGEQNCDQLTA
ncbi:rho-related GTP-binding protein RhoU-like [Corythoichthys intestinalis]|uniref:rho-related GTP-binding protein RhoU-like n=1 Tax=Corythoichthys intestinalis TaxID=161448 RepID=UPI0025A62751|nr:rho-related GTP-binding protein RhoU-like [Corythoichthys intestinalis]XP_061791526.1 rho-related GTP-binding protein RhoU-like [Nerophis lumbriciformis]